MEEKGLESVVSVSKIYRTEGNANRSYNNNDDDDDDNNNHDDNYKI